MGSMSIYYEQSKVLLVKNLSTLVMVTTFPFRSNRVFEAQNKIRLSVDEKEEVKLLLESEDASSYEQLVTISKWIKCRKKSVTLCELEMYLWEDSPIHRQKERDLQTSQPDKQ